MFVLSFQSQSSITRHKNNGHSCIRDSETGFGFPGQRAVFLKGNNDLAEPPGVYAYLSSSSDHEANRGQVLRLTLQEQRRSPQMLPKKPLSAQTGFGSERPVTRPGECFAEQNSGSRRPRRTADDDRPSARPVARPFVCS